MSAPAPVTEAHIELAKTALFSRDKAGRLLTAPMAAQLIADSEAKAVFNAAKSNWSESIGFIISERDRLRQQVANLTFSNDSHRETAETWRTAAIENIQLRADLDAIKAIRDEEKARAERAEAELAGIRALADRRNKRYHVEDTTHQLVAALDQALDIAQAELKAERARLDWLMAGGVCMVQHTGGFHVSRLHAPVSRAAIDAAMKEGGK